MRVSFEKTLYISDLLYMNKVTQSFGRRVRAVEFSGVGEGRREKKRRTGKEGENLYLSEQMRYEKGGGGG